MFLINWLPKSFHITHLIVRCSTTDFEEAKTLWSCLSLIIITFQSWVQYICLGISSGEHKPSKVWDSESWEGFQTSSFWPNTGFCIIYWLLLFLFKNAFNILIIWHWFLHFFTYTASKMLLAAQWKYKRMQWPIPPNYLAYCGQESVDKVEAIQKNQKHAECRNPPLSQKRLERKRNHTSVPYPPVAPICLVCQVKDVLF